MIEIDFQIGPRPFLPEQAREYQRILVTIGHDYKVTNQCGVFEVFEDTSRGPERHMIWHPGAISTNPETAIITVQSSKKELEFEDPAAEVRRPLEAMGFREVAGITQTYARNIGGVLVLFTDKEIDDKLHHSFEPLPERVWNGYRRVAIPSEYFNETATVISFDVPSDHRLTPLLLRERIVYCNGVAIPSGIVHVRHRMGGKD